MAAKVDPTGLEAWSPWHPSEVFHRLRSVGARWHVAGGWALDLWHGVETRRHEDIEIAVMRDDFSKFRRALPGMQFFCAGSGQVQRLRHGVKPPDSVHKVWCMGAAASRWKLDIMLEPGTAERWVFRRGLNIWRLRAEITGRTKDGCRS